VFSASTIMVAPSSTSGLSVTVVSNTPLICTVAGTTVTFVTVGQCNLTASQAGNADYLAAMNVTQQFAVGVASQTITFPVQSPSSRSFSAGASFSINPLATASSGLTVTYSSTTPGVCTVAGQNVTQVSVGTCTIAANQSGNANFSAAAQVTRNVTINAVAASAPQNLAVVARDGRGVFSFDPPSNNGGSAITSYTVTCGAVTGNGTASPVTVNGLTNGVSTNCSVAANTAAGAGASANFAAFTPNVQSGSTYWTQICTQCHASTPTVPQTNAGGTTVTVLNYVIANQPLMSAEPNVTSLTTAEKTAIVGYIASVTPAASVTTAFNTAKVIDLSNQYSVGTVAFESLEVVTGPASGMLSAFTGTSITYTPTNGFAGADSFTVRGKRTTPSAFVGDTRTVNVTVQVPPAPVITSSTTVNATFGVMGTYQITATNSPSSFGASGLPGGCSINTMSGLITCTPMAAGTFMVTVTATNPGGTGMQPVTVTVSKANQTITFGGQGGQTYGLNGMFAISPVATASSGLTVTHSSLTPGVCTVLGTTVTMVTGGTCTLAADQAGNANFNAALQVTQNVAIAATAPGQPTSLVATPGPLSASIAFTAPASNGGSPITGYTASCTPSAMGGAASSPINLTMLSNGVTYTCTVSAINAIGSTASMSVMVTPTAALSSPAFTSNSSVTFNVLAASTFSVTASGNPAPTLSVNTPPPSGLSFVPGTGVLSGTPATGTAGDYSLTFTAMNSQGSVMQTLMLKIAQLSQTITFNNPGTQSFTASTIPLTASSTSGLTVAFASNSPTVCTVSGTNLTLVTTGVCSITASQAGNADYTGATDVTRAFSVNAANQTITFNTQSPSSRSFLAGSTFSINPQASASSGLTVLYSSTTTGICTVAGTTVTMVAPGTCTIAANQGGNANYNMAAQVTQNVSLNATAPGAPTIGIATGGNGQATIDFTAPTNNGGSAITGYVATCNPGGITGNATAAPVVVTGLTNSTQYTCSVAAINAIGTGTSSATVNVTPLSGQGSTIWANVCDTCHTTVPSGNQLNGAGTTATVLNFVRANQPLMMNWAPVQALNAAELADVAAYIASTLPANSPVTTTNTPVTIDLSHHITFTGQAWSAFTSIEIVTPPAHGSLGAFSGTQVLYTPTMGYTGTDTFTYRGKRAGVHDGDPQTITLTINPPAPGISSMLSATATFGAAFNYQIAATGSPTSFGATGLPAGLTVDAMTGAITGTPTVTGSFVVDLAATNSGGTGHANLMLTVNLATQVINFPAQTTSTSPYVQGGTFAIAPTATGGLSGNSIVYGSGTPVVCSVNMTTVSILRAGICTLSADQSGNANYAAATQVTRSVNITPISPTAPTIGNAIPGNAQATVSFTPPTNDGGAAIETYTVTCGAQSATGPSSPITVTGLANGVTVNCSVTANNALAPSGPSSGTLMVTPIAIQFANAVNSRKTQNGAPRDILIDHTIPPAGNVAIEPRIGNAAHTIVFDFTAMVSNPGTLVVTNVANGQQIMGPTAAPSGNSVVVTLTNVPEIARITISLTGVNGAVNTSASMGLLPGDVNNSGKVTAADIAAVKAKSGNTLVDGTNFKLDINATGTISSTDVNAAKARAGQVLP
jgi:mono/diheme cytochrome c family protein